ncbi:hypothetical protein KY358_07075 [Candidatus Woesearchaeota archaeon]|nr:hypothetical protein [Candidatus Woesearchaeota archaeon]
MLSKVVPLHGSFMLTAIVGFLISALYIYRQLGNKTWGFTFMLFFAAMFVAAIISMTYSPVLPELEKKKKR